MQQHPQTFKEKVIQALIDLPADITPEEAIEQILLIEKIEEGLKAKREGKLLSHDEVKDRFSAK